MAEPLSLVASLITVLQISGSVILCCYEYRKSVKSASKSLLRVISEVTSLRDVVERLIALVDDEKMANHSYLSTLTKIMSTGGSLDVCQHDLERLRVKLEKPVNEWKALRRRLTWPLQEKEVAKTLGSVYQTKSVLETALMVDNTASIIEIRDATRDLRERVLGFIELSPDTKFQTVMEWLNGSDQSIKHHELRETREANTGSWFLKRKDYERWQTEPSSSFWLHGIPGCGKTILCSTIIEDIIHQPRREQISAILYHYFDFSNKVNSSVESLYRSLVAQLAKQKTELPQALDKLARAKFKNTGYDLRMGRETNLVAQPSLSELSDLFDGCMEEFDHIYIILDALDECVERQNLLSVVKRLISSENHRLHVLVTSRSDWDIMEQLTPLIAAHVLIEGSLIEPDICSYVRNQLRNNLKLRKWPQNVQERVESALMAGSQGMFRWVVCQIEVLLRCRTPKQIDNALRNPPKDLADTYRRTLETLDPESYELIQKLLRWLTVSSRPIRLDEAVEIIAMNIQDENRIVFDPEMRLIDPSDVLTISSSLIYLSRTSIKNREGVIVEEVQELRLAHSSVKEFLLVYFQEQPLPLVLGSIDTHAYVAECCLVYLLHLRDPLIDEKDINEAPLARYAAEWWIHHMQCSKTTTSPVGTQLMLSLMDYKSIPFLNWRRLYNPDMPWRGIDVNADSHASPLYYASQGGLEHLVEQLLKSRSKPDEGKGVFGTPLQVAAYNAHLNVAQQLLSAGADPNQEAGMFCTPLKAAAANGHVELVRLLIQYGADPNICTMNSGTALLEATKNRYTEITRILIEDAQADVNIYGDRKADKLYGGSTNALEIATRIGDLDIVSQIIPRASKSTISVGLKAAFEIKSRKLLELYAMYEPDGVLHYAATLGWGDLVTTLLQNDAATTSVLDYGPFGDEDTPASAIVASAAQGHESIVRELISKQADVNAVSDRRYALESAAEKGFSFIVSLLLEHGAQVNTYGLNGTALQQASYQGNLDIVRKLLDHGADPNIVDGSYGGPLQAAVIGGHHEVVQLLLDQGADVNAQPGRRWYRFPIDVSSTALAAAANRGDVVMVEFLLSKGAHVNLQDWMHPSALYVSAKTGHSAIVSKLLSAGAEIEIEHGSSTPLRAAVKENRLAAAQVLLKAGANANHCASGEVPNKTLLEQAILNGNDEMLKLLIDFGAAVNAVSGFEAFSEGHLHRATEQGRLEMVRILLENGADCNWQSNSGWAASHLAARGHPDILRLLYDDYQADLSSRLSNGSLSLHSAASGGNVECIEIILGHNVDVNSRNYLGRTPMHYAAENGHLEALRVLLQHGAKIDIKEEETQMTPLDYVKMELEKQPDDRHRQKIVELLEERTA